MAAISTALRRTLLLLTVAVAVSATATWWRRRSATPMPAAPPEWPALATEQDGTAAATGTGRGATGATWVPPGADGSVPSSHPIKAKETSGIYHVPGGRFYDRTKPDRCYATASAAEADGYRQSKT